VVSGSYRPDSIKVDENCGKLKKLRLLRCIFLADSYDTETSETKLGVEPVKPYLANGYLITPVDRAVIPDVNLEIFHFVSSDPDGSNFDHRLRVKDCDANEVVFVQKFGTDIDAAKRSFKSAVETNSEG
jgi:hypothetical protein